jgi:hypothetical protein
MKVIALEQTDLSVAALAELVQKGTVILTRKGKPLVAMTDLRGSDWEAVSLANNPQFLALIEAARREYREKGGTSLDEIRKEVGLPGKPRRRSGKSQFRGSRRLSEE